MASRPQKTRWKGTFPKGHAPGDLARDLDEAMRDEKGLVARATAGVTDWMYALEPMLGTYPLFREIGYRGHQQWKPARRRWLTEPPQERAYRHGLDAEGRVLLIESGYGGVILFQPGPDRLDEIHLAGRVSSLSRARRDGERTVALGKFSLERGEYNLETFEYDRDGRCVRSIKRYGFDEEAAGSVLFDADYVYDADGLLRVDASWIGEPKKRMYQRAGARKPPVKKGTRKAATAEKTAPRRPLVAYTVAVPPDADDPNHLVYSDAYGLEMTIDNEWPIDTVLLVPPERIEAVTGQVDLSSLGTVYAGMSEWPRDAKVMKKAVAAGAQWGLLDGTDPEVLKTVARRLPPTLQILLSVDDPQQVAAALDAARIPPERLVVAFRSPLRATSASAQKLAARIREELASRKGTASRIVMTCRGTTRNLFRFVSKPDIDGVLILEGNFETALEVLSPLAASLAEGDA